MFPFNVYDCSYSFESRASDYGLMKIDKTGRIIHFAEKPKGADLEAMVSIELFSCRWVIYNESILQSQISANLTAYVNRKII